MQNPAVSNEEFRFGKISQRKRRQERDDDGTILAGVIRSQQ